MTAPPANVTGPDTQPAEKRRYVRSMFTAIAPRYDLLNRIMSARVDVHWRRVAIAHLGWESRPEGVYLDACAGTLDLADTLARCRGFRGRVVATDFVLPMLKLGRTKPPAGQACVAVADTVELPVRDETFDGATVGFGLRNLGVLDQGLRELARVLKPGARLVILDLATPGFAPLRGAYLFYFRNVLPRLGRLISGHPTAYSYLPESVKDFPPPPALEGRLRAAGFRITGHKLLTGGIVAVVWGTR